MAAEDTLDKIMSKTVRFVASDETLSVALKQMVEYEVGSVLVMQGESPMGIVTERDVVRRLASEGPPALLQTAGRIASKPLIVAGPGMEVWEAFTIMLQNKIRRIPIMSGGKLLGIVTERDLFKWVVRVTYEPNIPENIKRLISQNP